MHFQENLHKDQDLLFKKLEKTLSQGATSCLKDFSREFPAPTRLPHGRFDRLRPRGLPNGRFDRPRAERLPDGRFDRPQAERLPNGRLVLGLGPRDSQGRF